MRPQLPLLALAILAACTTPPITRGWVATERDDGTREQLRVAAESGEADAALALGRDLRSDTEATATEASLGVAWTRRAAEQGLPDAMHDLGLAHLHGDGVPADDAHAARWIQAAADAGLPAAQQSLSRLYEDGRGVGRSAQLAYRWQLISGLDAARARALRAQLGEVQARVAEAHADQFRPNPALAPSEGPTAR